MATAKRTGELRQGSPPAEAGELSGLEEFLIEPFPAGGLEPVSSRGLWLLLGPALVGGFPCFQPWGKAASWPGAFLPLTIRGLNLCLTVGQFSAACAGLHLAVAPASTPKATSSRALFGISHNQTSERYPICPTAAATQISKRALAW